MKKCNLICSPFRVCNHFSNMQGFCKKKNQHLNMWYKNSLLSNMMPENLTSLTTFILFPSKYKQGSSWDLRLEQKWTLVVFVFENLKPFLSAKYVCPFNGRNQTLFANNCSKFWTNHLRSAEVKNEHYKQTKDREKLDTILVASSLKFFHLIFPIFQLTFQETIMN